MVNIIKEDLDIEELDLSKKKWLWKISHLIYFIAIIIFIFFLVLKS